MLRNVAIIALALVFSASPAAAQSFPSQDPKDKVFEEVGVDEKLNEKIPLELNFTDESGKSVKLSDYFTGGPVVLSLNYYECPMLCPMIFRNLADSINKLAGLGLERDFRVVTVSFNPRETLEMAREKSRTTHEMLNGVTNPSDRWPFLFGSGEQIAPLLKATGFRYKEIEPNNFAHPNVLMVITPEGKISRYLYGLDVKPLDLKLALLDATQGKIGKSTALNRVMMYCYEYDPAGRRYSLIAMNVMKLSGLATLIIFGSLIAMLWLKDRRKTGQ